MKRKEKTRVAKTSSKAGSLAASLAEKKKNRRLAAATERFLKSGIIIKDIYATL